MLNNIGTIMCKNGIAGTGRRIKTLTKGKKCADSKK
jgi:hypothetical protein